MCGVVAVISPEPVEVDLAGALHRLRHRGPDGRGFMAWDPTGGARWSRDPLPGPAMVHLGHVRLSIIDVSEAGAQPMSWQDGRYWISFNGEVYNYRELRAELEGFGHLFRSHTDTEVVLAALVHWGPQEALARFVGMFALVMVDTRSRTVTVARDAFGIKPLYWAAYARGIAFSSEIAPLLALPGVDREVDAERCWHYLRYGITDHGGRSLLKGIRQVPPAHWASWNLASELELATKLRRYWDPAAIGGREISLGEAADRFRGLFLDSIRLHLRSDVPVGAALSGGLDSSAIVCAMRHLDPGQEIHAFTYAAADSAISEMPWASAVAGHVGARMHEVTADATAFAADLEKLIRAQGEPFGSTRIYAQYAVFRAAREAGIPVMLDGQGADELLAGYAYYQSYRLASLIVRGRWCSAFALARAQSSWPGRRPMATLARACEPLLPPSMVRIGGRLFGSGGTAAWAKSPWFQARGVAVDNPFHRGSGTNRLRCELAESVATTQLPHLLRYEDRNSMAFSVESRVPFLTSGLAEFLLSLPEQHLVGPDGTSKLVLRRALRGIVPDAILDRRDKIGFETPELAWLRGCPALIDRALELAASTECMNPDGVRQLVGEALSGRRRFDFQIWRLVNFALWSGAMAA